MSFYGTDYDEDGQPVEATGRRVILTPASQIKPRPVRWTWTDRLAVGTLGLLAGREGAGKSTLAYWLAARLTRGEIPGEHEGTPKGVLVAATEDSWEHTIVPRLIAAGADLERVYRIEVLSDEDVHAQISLPRDLHSLEEHAAQADAALLLLDPLMSRLSGQLDTHRDGDVRRALEPLVAVADRCRMAVLGLIHHNKSGSTDALQLVMASKAFTAVARSVHTVIPDPDDDTGQRQLFGTPKNNLGRSDLPVHAFTVVSHQVDTDEGPAYVGRIEWGEEIAGTIADAVERAAGGRDERSAVSEAGDWLKDYLEANGGRAASAEIKGAGAKAGHSYDSLKRARRRLRLTVEHIGFPRTTDWATPVGADRAEPVGATPRGECVTAPTTPTEGESPRSQTVGAVGAGFRDQDLTLSLSDDLDFASRHPRCPACRGTLDGSLHAKACVPALEVTR